MRTVVSISILLGFLCMPLLLIGVGPCESAPLIRHRQRVTKPDGTKTETETTVRGASSAKDASTLETPGVKAEAGPGYAPPKTDTAVKVTARWSMIAAIAFGALAVGALVGRRWLPCLPSNLPVGLGALAGVFYAGPIVLDRYAWAIAIGALGWGAWVLWSYMHNRKLKKSDPEA